MRPRTVIIALVLILALGIGARVFFLWSGWIPGEHDDLKEATALRINYTINGQTRSVKITNPAEVREVLASMQFKSTTGRGRRYRFYRKAGGVNNTNMVEFLYPGGSSVQTSFRSPLELSRSDRDSVTLTSRSFYEKICDILSREEGRKIDVIQLYR